MKKFIILLLFLTSFIFLPNNVYASDTITVYLFRGNTCQHCEDALEYLNNNRDLIPQNVEIITYEVFQNDANATLMDTVADTLNIDKTENYGTPLFIVGNEYIKGYGTNTWQELFTMAEEYLDSDTYTDVVADTIELENIDAQAISFTDLYSEPNQLAVIIVYCVFGLIIVGFIVMITVSRK